MLKMILNNKEQEPIYILSLNKTLVTNDSDAKYNINGNLADNNITNGIDFLAQYYKTAITSIAVYNTDNILIMQLNECDGIVVTLTESISDNNYHSYYELLIR